MTRALAFHWVVAALGLMGAGLTLALPRDTGTGAVVMLVFLFVAFAAIVHAARREGARSTAWRTGSLLLLGFAFPALLSLAATLTYGRVVGGLLFLAGPALMVWAALQSSDSR